MLDAMAEARGLCRRFGDAPAVDHVDFAVRPKGSSGSRVPTARAGGR
jgi:hypothetical protein